VKQQKVLSAQFSVCPKTTIDLTCGHFSEDSHFSRQPGKFHTFGKPEHWMGFTAWIRQTFTPSRKRHSPFGLSMIESPLRLEFKRVLVSMNSCSSMPM
jgi:hypothetical protein